MNGVANTYIPIPVENTYINPIVACTNNLPSTSINEGSASLRISSLSIQVKVQPPLNSAVIPSTV